MAKIIVIGGGIAGCTTAIELAKRGHRVVILEQAQDILQGTSARTPGRMGLGYHYFDLNTAKLYMENTVEFMKKYSDCFLGDKDQPYLRDGRYFVVKDSLIPLQNLMATYDAVSHHFEEMCQRDPSNKIFQSLHLHRTLDPSEFEDDVNLERISFAIQTKECLLNWKKFDQRLRKEIAGYKNISIKTDFKVDNIKTSGNGFTLISSSAIEESSDYVINCTWQNIEFLNEKLGISNSNFFKKDPHMTSRLKLLAEVKLPEKLIKKHSMFFCVGPHAMFSNLGDGIGRITYAPVTNFGTTNKNRMPDVFEKWLREGLDEKETRYYGQKIINGVATYIPAMKDAEIIKVIPGIVKSKGDVDINNKNSAFHKRDYDGVAERQIGWVENAAMKLFYCLGNARKTADIIDKQTLAKKDIREIVELIVSQAKAKKTLRKKTENPQIFEQFFTNHLQKFTSDYFETTANQNIVEEAQKLLEEEAEETGPEEINQDQNKIIK
jgi:hypothetical protein